MNKTEVIETIDKYYLSVLGRYNLVLDHGDGMYLYDIEGKKYLDFFAGIAVNSLGYNDPDITKAISKYFSLIHCSNVFYTEIQARLIKELSEISGLDKVFLTNSGTESNECAIKITRKFGKKNGGKYKILSCTNSFHGRSFGALSATGQTKYQKGFEPMLESFEFVKYNDCADLEAKFNDDIVAFIAEPIQGEGGVIPARADFLKLARQLCDKHNALLIFDEVQTGVCRTGFNFCWQYYGVKPDIMTLAKALGNGFPIGAALVADRAASVMEKGEHGSTFAGGPMASAAAFCVLEKSKKLDLSKNAKEVGQYLMDELKKFASQCSMIKDIRGLGLLVGIELDRPSADFVKKALEKGLIINSTAGNVLRFAPPLIATKQNVDEMMKILKEVVV
jgi:acetylornithine/N-succinyldiaminopimelate aminotransferase